MPPALEQQAEIAAAYLRAVVENSAVLASIKAAAAASRQATATGQAPGAATPPPRLPIEQLVTAFVKAIFETQVRSQQRSFVNTKGRCSCGEVGVTLAGHIVPGFHGPVQHTPDLNARRHEP